MKKLLYALLLCLPLICFGQNFDDYFTDKTLRLDYIFGGNSEQEYVFLDQLNELPSWAGKRHNLSSSFLDGNGQIKVYDVETDSCIYKHTFSSLFQEWTTTEEAKHISKSFENVFLIPLPKKEARVEVSFRDRKGKYNTLLTHEVNPKDILIHKKGYKNITPYTVIGNANDAESRINVAIVAEGFAKDEIVDFQKYAEETVKQIFLHKPFDKYKDNFNFYIVESVSDDSGVSVPRKGEWKNTAVGSNFDTFYSDRYLTSSRVKDIHDILAGIPYEHIIILANTDVYGGGGIFNSYTLTTTSHAEFKPVVVHEFGHSFAGLADEYFYNGDVLDNTYPKDVEPWEQNITTMVNFDAKWKDMLLPNVPIPAPLADSTKYETAVFEGAGYASHEIYRSRYDCRMKTNACKDFCPVCQRSIERLILSYLKEE